MPIYEYQCDDCGHQFETMQKMSDDALKECPACKNLALRKLVSAAAFRLKGKGWYETDFKDGNKKNLSSGAKTPGDKKADSKGSEKSTPTAKADKPKQTSGDK